MSTQFNIPTVGSNVAVTVRMKHFSGYGDVDQVFTGAVVPNNKWENDEQYFAVNDNNPDWPRHVIPIDWVVDLKFADGTVATQSEVSNGVQTWEVAGSKPGVKYTVTKRGNKLSCNCPGFQFRHKCKHCDGK